MGEQRRWHRAWLAARWGLRLHNAVLLLLILLFGYGTPAKDARAVDQFVQATRRWVVNPEYREVQAQYVRLGTAATRATVAGTTAGSFIMGMRSVPFLPANLAANEGSQHHYDEFGAGELRAYFRLSEEQGTDWVIESLRALDRPDVTDAELRGFLEGFKTDEPLVVDEGAVRSLRRLIEDARPASLPHETGDVATQLKEATAQMVRERGRELEQLTPEQQAEIFDGLDAWVKAKDPELWRVKQVNDFLNGIWAQSFGQTYARWIGPLVTLWWVCRIAGPIWLIVWIALAVRRSRTQKSKFKIQK